MYLDTSLRPQGEQQQVGTLKLSEAIRIGARIRPQCIGTFFAGSGSCAIGAALEGFGIQYQEGILAAPPEAVRAFPQIFRDSTGANFTDLGDEIYKRNDRGGWTRERIADWLEAQGL